MAVHQIGRCGFLKGAGAVTGGVLIGVRVTGKAIAATRELSQYMGDRLGGVYGADSKFPRRASQDNQQVSELYANYLGKPLGYKSEQLLHTKWFDKSAKVKELQAKGKFPNPRFEKEFADGTYPYE